MLFALPQTVLSQNPPTPTAPAVTYLERTVTTPDGSYGYRVFVPGGRDGLGRGARNRPAILFLHGSGERGDDNEAQTRNGISLLIASRANGGVERFPAIVVAPQCRANSRWTDPAMKRMAYAALDASLKEFGGDPKRVLLTGLSLGGYGTWAWAQEDPGRWVAIAPVCGGLRFRNQAAEPGSPDAYSVAAATLVATKIPVWAFHGDADGSVPVSESRQMVAALVARRANVRYSEYAGVGHNSWDAAYSEPGLLPWFLSARRR